MAAGGSSRGLVCSLRAGCSHTLGSRQFGSLLRKSREAVGFHVPRGTAVLREHYNSGTVSSSARTRIAEAAQQRDWSAAEEVFEGLESPATTLWEAILHAADRCERLAEAEDLFQRLKADQFARLRVRAFNSLINLNSRRGNVERVEELVASMRSEGVRPDVMLYSVILNGYARRGNVEAAERAWQEMLDAGLSPTVVSYVSLLNVLAEAGRPDLAVARVDEMKMQNLQPQVQHWNVVLKACQRALDGSAAERTLEKMKEHGVAPNVASYTATLLAIVREAAPGFKESVQALIESMEREGVEPDGHFYETLAIARLGVGTTEEALAALAGADLAGLEAAAKDLHEAQSKGLWLSGRAAHLRSAVESTLSHTEVQAARDAAGGATALQTGQASQEDWVEVQTAGQDPYFWNRANGITQWERPLVGSIPRVQA